RRSLRLRSAMSASSTRCFPSLLPGFGLPDCSRGSVSLPGAERSSPHRAHKRQSSTFENAPSVDFTSALSADLREFTCAFTRILPPFDQELIERGNLPSRRKGPHKRRKRRLE